MKTYIVLNREFVFPHSHGVDITTFTAESLNPKNFVERFDDLVQIAKVAAEKLLEIAVDVTRYVDFDKLDNELDKELLVNGEFRDMFVKLGVNLDDSEIIGFLATDKENNEPEFWLDIHFVADGEEED